MLRLLALAAQAGVILLAAYNGITALWGWRNRTPAPPGARSRRFRVVVPAHNEEAVVGGLLADLAGLDYPASLVSTWVIADRCHDDSARVAESHGAQIAERTEGPPGKGPALAWYLRLHPVDDEETLVVLDADNRVPPDLLSRLADELDQGHQALQCYLDVTNPDDSPLAEASALSYWASNRMVQLARSNLGWSADLGGTGMALTPAALASAGGFDDSLTEDQDLTARLVLAGHRVEWLHDVRVSDQTPTSLWVAMRQRARWMAGKRATRRSHLGALLGHGTPASIDLAVRLAQPGRSFVALISGLLTVLALVTGSAWLLPWPVWAGATVVQVLEPIPFLARDGVEPRRLFRYPMLVLLAGMWVPVRFLSARVSGWYHTPHQTPAESDRTR